MTKRIFHAIYLVALAVFLASMVLIMGVLYTYFSGVQRDQLKIQTDLAAQGVALEGMDYFDGLELNKCRITWVDTDGAVLYDSTSDAESMENHLQREEIAEALKNGWGESARYSNTLMERSLYYALRLPDGTVLRLSTAQNSVLTLLLGMAQSMCVIIAVALVLSLVLASRLSKRIVKPLNGLNLDAPLENEGYDELAPLLRRIDSQQRQLKGQAADLKRKQEEFTAVTRNMQEGLVLLGSQDTILSINPAAAGILGAASDCVGKDILTVNRSPQVQELLKTAHSGRQAEETLTMNGRDYRLDASPVSSDGAVTGVVLLLVDVTEKAHSEQMRREFTANVSHELKTPLHAISGYAELMAGGIAKEADMQKFAGNIYTEAQRMIRLVEDILRLSLLDEGGTGLVWERTDLYALAEETVAGLIPEAERTGVTVTLSGEPAPVFGVQQLLTSILHNLCDNAIKYNRPGGKVNVHIGTENGQAVLSVADTGIGIPKECQSRIFERFYRVDKSRSKAVGGTGLGLSIVKHAAMILDAKIQIQSAPGKGTTITVHIPQDQKAEV